MISIFPSSLPCPLLDNSSSNEGTSFIRSPFVYAPRQRKIRCSKPTFNVSMNFDQSQYDIFIDFYENTLKGGSKEFQCDWTVHGIVSNQKIVRFTSEYKLQPLKGGLYKMSIVAELLERGV